MCWLVWSGYFTIQPVSSEVTLLTEPSTSRSNNMPELYLCTDVQSGTGSDRLSPLINNAALFLMVYGNSLFHRYKILWIKWCSVNLALLTSIVTFTGAPAQAQGQGCSCPPRVRISATALFLSRALLWLSVTAEFLNFLGRSSPFFQGQAEFLTSLKHLHDHVTCHHPSLVPGQSMCGQHHVD